VDLATACTVSASKDRISDRLNTSKRSTTFKPGFEKKNYLWLLEQFYRGYLVKSKYLVLVVLLLVALFIGCTQQEKPNGKINHRNSQQHDKKERRNKELRSRHLY